MLHILQMIENPFNETKIFQNTYSKYVIGTKLEHVFDIIWKNQMFKKTMSNFSADDINNENDFENYEFEIRLGVLNEANCFSPYIDKEYFTKIFNKFHKNSYFKTTKWYQEESYYWTYDQMNIRTTMIFDGNHLKPLNIKKMTLFNKNIDTFNGKYIMRFAISSENDIDKSIYDKQLLIKPNYIRIKIRNDFIYKNIWRYSFIKIWEGSDKNKVEQNQKKNPDKPKYSIELELIDNSLMKKDPTLYLSSLFLKGIDLLK
jgi:hypothetical protein